MSFLPIKYVGMEHHAVPLQPTWSVVYPIFFRPGARLFRPAARLTCLIAAAFHFHFDTSNFKTVMDENEESCTFEILPVVLYVYILPCVSFLQNNIPVQYTVICKSHSRFNSKIGMAFIPHLLV